MPHRGGATWGNCARTAREPRTKVLAMPLTVFDTKSIPATRRGRMEAAVVAGRKHVAAPHEAWISADPFRGGVRVVITGPHGFQREVRFALDEVPAAITDRVRGNAGRMKGGGDAGINFRYQGIMGRESFFGDATASRQVFGVKGVPPAEHSAFMGTYHPKRFLR